MDVLVILLHSIGFLLTGVITYFAVKTLKIAEYPIDWSFITLGLMLVGIARGLYLLNDINDLFEIMDNLYYIGLFVGTIGIMFELIGIYLLSNRIRRIIK